MLWGLNGWRQQKCRATERARMASTVEPKRKRPSSLSCTSLACLVFSPQSQDVFCNRQVLVWALGRHATWKLSLLIGNRQVRRGLWRIPVEGTENRWMMFQCRLSKIKHIFIAQNSFCWIQLLPPNLVSSITETWKYPLTGFPAPTLSPIKSVCFHSWPSS